jgi:FlaA1/EpsC-like NDP-sugar epimerase
MINIIRHRLQILSAKSKLVLLMLSDMTMAMIAWVVFGPPLINFIATEFKYSILSTIFNQFFQFLIPALSALFFMWFFGFYRSLIRFFDSMDAIFVAIIGSLIFGFGWALIYLGQINITDSSIIFISFLQGIILSFLFYALINISRIIAKILIYPKSIEENAIPVVIYGAGAAGKELMEAVQIDKNKNLIAFYDDSRDLKNRLINNVPIYGAQKKLQELKFKYPNLEVLLAIPSLDNNKRKDVISKLEELKISVRTVPAFHELIFDEKKMSDIQSLSIDDLIPGRNIEDLNILDSRKREFLITGSGGSIGSEIVRQLLNQNPKKIILFEISEYSLFRIFEEAKLIKAKQELSTQIIPILGNILDTTHLQRIFQENDVDTIYHAAAYKHVPLVQDHHNISKSLENNFIGTYRVANQAAKSNVKSFVLISTDKAVRPTNIMGGSKRMAEMAIQVINQKNPNINLSMVRFGNVINSSGSVIPLFLEQISKGGPVTITHKDVERYFMTIPEASNLVIQAGEMSVGGEVFILDMGKQMKVLDIAKRLIHLSGRSVSESSNGEGIEILEVGLRDGEKMYEELLISGNEIETKNKRIFMSNEEFVNQKTFDDILDSCSSAIELNDIDAIVNIMRRYVDGFTYEN